MNPVGVTKKSRAGSYQSGQMGQTVNLLAYAFGGSNPSLPTPSKCGNSSVGRARPCQGRGREFEPRFPLHFKGALVQLVRIHACHAWGHGFESRTHRNQKQKNTEAIFGALVQLVRIHACHAWGHGFESRTHRKPT